MNLLLHIALGANLASIVVLLYVRKRILYFERLQDAQRKHNGYNTYGIGKAAYLHSLPDDVLKLIIDHHVNRWLFVCKRTRALAIESMFRTERMCFEEYSRAMQFRFNTSLAEERYLERYVLTCLNSRPRLPYVCASCGKEVHQLASCTECVKTVG